MDLDLLGRRRRRDNSSGFIGVTQDKTRWRARIRSNGKLIWQAWFLTAAEARDAREVELRRRKLIPRAISAREPPSVRGARWIQLTHGKFVLVDAEDFDRVASFNWRFSRGYAVRDESRSIVFLHHMIKPARPGRLNDHVSRDRLDCRKRNLRAATPTESVRNRGRNRNSTSGFIGVTWSKAAEKWAAQASIGRKHVHLGLFATAEEAAKARDLWVREHHGAFASLNFAT
jgi:hypothetical protein